MLLASTAEAARLEIQMVEESILFSVECEQSLFFAADVSTINFSAIYKSIYTRFVWRSLQRSSGCIYNLMGIKPGPNEDESWWEFKRGWELMRVQTLTLVWHGTLMHSHRLSCALIDFERVHIFHESRWEFSLVWPELVIVDESWRKLSWESTLRAVSFFFCFKIAR